MNLRLGSWRGGIINKVRMWGYVQQPLHVLFKCLGMSRCGAAHFKGLKIRGGDESCSVRQRLKTGSANIWRLYWYVVLKRLKQRLFCAFDAMMSGRHHQNSWVDFRGSSCCKCALVPCIYRRWVLFFKISVFCLKWWRLYIINPFDFKLKGQAISSPLLKSKYCLWPHPKLFINGVIHFWWLIKWSKRGREG